MRTHAARVSLVLVVSIGSFASAQPDAPDPSKAVRLDGIAQVRAWHDRAGDEMRVGAIIDDIWSHSTAQGYSEFLASEEQVAALRAAGVRLDITDQNVQARIDAEIARLRGRAPGQFGDAAWFDDYKNLAEVHAYMAGLAAANPALMSPGVVVGKSVENRDILAYHISGPKQTGSSCRPLLLINGCQHAREWISPMCVVYYADRLVSLYGVDPQVTALMDSVEFVIIPVVNPDGYEHSWNVSRFWRKNRRPNSNGSFGVDLNRNWSHAWGTTLPGGSGGNANPSSDTYWGTAPFSEPETKSVSDYAVSLPNLRGSNDVHSYGQLILHAWNSSPSPSPDDSLLKSMTDSQAAAIKAVHGLTYVNGRGYNVLYPHSGTATDWFYAEGGAMSCSFELRGPTFDPPPSTILPCAEETFDAIKSNATFLASTFTFIADWDHDCEYTLFDFLGYQNSFAAGEPEADLNGDGALDFFDFLLFQNLFATKK